MIDSWLRRRLKDGRNLFNNVVSNLNWYKKQTFLSICTYIIASFKQLCLFFLPYSNTGISFLTMHTFLLIAAYLSATTLATPVAQLFDTFEEDFASLNNQQSIKNLPQDFNSAVGELEPDGSTGQEGGNNAPLFLTGDTTTSYLQAQVPSQVTFGNFGAGCPSKKLFCCQGGSGSPGTLISDAAFNGRCIPCMSSIFKIPQGCCCILLNLNWENI